MYVNRLFSLKLTPTVSVFRLLDWLSVSVGRQARAAVALLPRARCVKPRSCHETVFLTTIWPMREPSCPSKLLVLPFVLLKD